MKFNLIFLLLLFASSYPNICLSSGNPNQIWHEAEQPDLEYGYGTITEYGFCCACGSTQNLFAYGNTHYCSTDFNRWIKLELDKTKTSQGSNFLSFTVGENGRRKTILKDTSDDEWLDHLNAELQEEVAKQEDSLHVRNLGGTVFSEIVSWLVQSVQTTKTCSNCLCCCCLCPQEAEEGALDYNRCCSSLWGNPYYERCPHCLTRIERSNGCSHMVCVKCKLKYTARGQVECPLGIANVGCYYCCCDSILDKGCWAIGPCETCKCRTPLAFCFPKEYVCQCPCKS